MKEYDFPTVRTGSLWLLVMSGVMAGGILWRNSEQTVEALKALLTALTGTHTVLVVGKGFIKSKWSGDTPEMTEIVTTQKTVSKATPTDPVAPTDQQVHDMSVTVKGDVNVKPDSQ